MRESLASAINSSDLKQREKPCSIDKVTTLGMASVGNDSIGADSIRFVEALNAKSYKELLYGLAKRLQRDTGFKNITRSMTHKICDVVIKEAALVSCHTCLGAKEIKGENKLFVCPTCNGTGLHRYTDRERAMALGMTEEAYLKGWNKKFATAQSLYTGKVRDTVRLVSGKYYD